MQYKVESIACVRETHWIGIVSPGFELSHLGSLSVSVHQRMLRQLSYNQQRYASQNGEDCYIYSHLIHHY